MYVNQSDVHCPSCNYNKGFTVNVYIEISHMSLWRNRLARSAVNRKAGGSSPPRDDMNVYSV